MVPVSATAKLAPLMPMSARANFSRSRRRPACASDGRIVRQCFAGVFRQDAGDALAGVMDGRGDEMRRPFAGQLDDELAKVGLRYLQAGRFQRRIEMHFLRGHRLRFDDALAFRFLGDLQNDAPGVLRRRRPVDMAAESCDRRFQLFEILVEMSERMFLDALGVIAEGAAVGQSGVAAAVAGQQRVGQPYERGLQRRIGQRLTGRR